MIYDKDILVALVEKSDDSQLSSEDIQAWLAQNLHPIQLPNQILLATRFPHLPNGEVDRYRLFKQLQSVLSERS